MPYNVGDLIPIRDVVSRQAIAEIEPSIRVSNAIGINNYNVDTDGDFAFINGLTISVNFNNTNTSQDIDIFVDGNGPIPIFISEAKEKFNVGEVEGTYTLLYREISVTDKFFIALPVMNMALRRAIKTAVDNSEVYEHPADHPVSMITGAQRVYKDWSEFEIATGDEDINLAIAGMVDNSKAVLYMSAGSNFAQFPTTTPGILTIEKKSNTVNTLSYRFDDRQFLGTASLASVDWDEVVRNSNSLREFRDITKFIPTVPTPITTTVDEIYNAMELFTVGRFEITTAITDLPSSNGVLIIYSAGPDAHAEFIDNSSNLKYFRYRVGSSFGRWILESQDSSHNKDTATSFNDYITPGIYNLYNPSNRPVGTEGATREFIVTVTALKDRNYVKQLIQDMNSNDIYIRTRVNGTWSSFNKIFTDGNYGTIGLISSSRSLNISDANKVITVNTAANITVPTEASVAFPTGTQITIITTGTGDVSIAAASGVTILSKDAKLTIDGQYASATLIKTSSSTWHLIGSLK